MFNNMVCICWSHMHNIIYISRILVNLVSLKLIDSVMICLSVQLCLQSQALLEPLFWLSSG